VLSLSLRCKGIRVLQELVARLILVDDQFDINPTLCEAQIKIFFHKNWHHAKTG
jgi:hypothetical protein